jgi:hypothetical protein
MGDKTYISSQVDEDSELYQRFEHYVDEKGHDNKSAAVRELVNSALENENNPWYDPNRPDGTLSALLYDAEQMKHTALLIAAVLIGVSGLVTAPILPGVVDGVMMLVALLYGLTAFFGFTAPVIRRLSPLSSNPTADGVEA